VSEWLKVAPSVSSNFFANFDFIFPSTTPQHEKEVFDQAHVLGGLIESQRTYDWESPETPLQLVNNKWTVPVYYTDIKAWGTVNGWKLWDLARDIYGISGMDYNKFPDNWIFLAHDILKVWDKKYVKGVNSSDGLHHDALNNDDQSDKNYNLPSGQTYAKIQLIMQGDGIYQQVYFTREHYRHSILPCWRGYNDPVNVEGELRPRWTSPQIEANPGLKAKEAEIKAVYKDISPTVYTMGGGGGGGGYTRNNDNWEEY